MVESEYCKKKKEICKKAEMNVVLEVMLYRDKKKLECDSQK